MQAWAALQVFAIDGGRDTAFLSRIFDKLLVNFTWWVNRQDADGSNVFEGGFLGLDNIGPIDRSHLPAGYMLEQADATGWMAAYALTMAAMAALLNRTSRPALDLVLKFLEHFALIAEAMDEKGLWDEEDGFYYDQLRRPDGSVVPIKVRSMVGVLPLTAFAVVDESAVNRARTVGKRFAKLLDRHDDYRHGAGAATVGDTGNALIGVVGVEHLLRVFQRLFDESSFLSPHGLRAVSRWHLEHPFRLDMGGYETSIDYEPAESTTRDVRWQLELARADLVPGQLPRRGRTLPLRALLRRRPEARVPDRLRRAAHARGDRRGHPAQADLALPRRRGQEASLPRLGRQAPERPALEGQRLLLRVLPRRQRGRAGGLAPDRVDGDRGGHDPPQPRRGDPDARRAARADGRRAARMIALGPQACGTAEESTRREWLVSDGLGGYAMGTVSGLRTRRYHGLLVVAAGGPSARMLGLAALDPVLVVGDARYRLATHEWASGAVDPRGYELLVSFELDRGVPRWRWQIGGIVLERELALTHGRAAVGVVHRLLRADRPVRLELGPLCTWRSVHGERWAGEDPAVETTADGFVFEGAYRVAGAGWTPGGAWYRGVRAREEAARGLDDVEDMWAPGTFSVELGIGRAHEVTAAAAPFGGELPAAAGIVRAARDRADALVRQAGVACAADAQLVLAADQFVIDHDGPTAVAGYPWFGEWSRDLMTSYEGLFLSTGASGGRTQRTPPGRGDRLRGHARQHSRHRHARVQHGRRHALVRPCPRPARRGDG